jgi:LacI family transcriptional regulator, galactose operon repressor
VSRQVDAIILATVLSSSEVAAMPIHGISRVLIDQSSVVHGVPWVSTDYEQGAAIGVQRLIGHGHHDIAILVGRDIDPSRVDPLHNGRKTVPREAGLPEGPVEFTDFTTSSDFPGMIWIRVKDFSSRSAQVTLVTVSATYTWTVSRTGGAGPYS